MLSGDAGEAERHSGMIPNPSEPSDSGISIVQEVFGFVKRNLSEALRRKDAARGERGAGKGAAALVPASAHVDPGARTALWTLRNVSDTELF